MAGRKRKSNSVAIPTNSLVASAVRYPSKPDATVRTKKSWQEECYRHYYICGEARFAAQFFGNSLSRASLYIGERTVNGFNRILEGPEVDHLDTLFNGRDGQEEMLKSIGVHLAIAGECYLVGRTVADGDIWEIVSVIEMKTQGNKWAIDYGDGIPPITLGDKDVVIRIWNPSPSRRMEADSPFRSLLPILGEIEWLTKNIFAQASSRLTGAGVLFLPQEMSFPPPPEVNGKPVEAANDAESFMMVLADGMMESLKGDGSPSERVPIIVTAPGEMIDKAKLMHFWSDLDDAAVEMRSEAVRRFALGMDIPPEQILGMSSGGGTGGGSSSVCVDPETEVMTQNGWTRHDALEIGDMALTLNHETGESEWQPVKEVHRYELTDEKMLLMDGSGHSSLSTMNHKWAVTRERQVDHQKVQSREWVRSEDLTYAHKIPTAAPSGDLPAEAKFSDDLVELAAWFWTEGYLAEKGNTSVSTIVQSHTVNPERVDRIRGCLNRLFPEGWGSEYIAQPQWGKPCTSFHLRNRVRDLLMSIGGKQVSLDFVRSMTRAQLELFIDVSCQGDGWHYRRGELDIWQRDPEALAAYELALILSGRMVSTTEHADGYCVYPWNKSTVRPIKAADSSTSRAVAEEVTYTGTVWCPEVENHAWLARRNGTVYYTGNSHWGAWQIEESTIKLHIEPMLQLVANALTVGYLRPGLDEDTTYVVTYDSSTLRLRPDRSKEAISLHDRGLLSDEALLRESGFEVTDLPQDDELKTWLLRKIASGSATPEQVGAALKALGVDLGTSESEDAEPETEEEPRESRPAPSLEDHPLPRRAPAASVLMAACEPLVLRALERAGNRLRTSGIQPVGIPSYETHTVVAVNGQAENLLNDAWPTAAVCLSGIADPSEVIPLLDDYCKELFKESAPHSRDRLNKFLQGVES